MSRNSWSRAALTSRAAATLLVCADLSRRSAEYGLSVEPFPQRYV